MFCTASVDRQTHDNSVQPGPGVLQVSFAHGQIQSACFPDLVGLGDKGKGEKHTIELNIKTLGTKKKLDFDFIQKVDSYI